jgi:hypothetical protein
MSDVNDFRPGDSENNILRKILARLDSLVISLGFTPENVANKTTDGTLAANSDTLYPSEKAVKTYADTKQSALGFTPENVANKDTDGTLAANSDTKYASQKAVKTYVDAGDVVAGTIDPGWYGDGSDNAQVFDGATTILGLVPAGNIYTLTQNIFLAAGSSLSNGATIKTSGYIIFCSGDFTVNGTVFADGGAGGKGVATGAGGSLGVGTPPTGASLTTAEIGGGNNGHVGAAGGTGNGSGQGGTSSLNNSTGGAGGTSGSGGAALAGGTGGAGFAGDVINRPKQLRFLTNRFSTGGATALITGGAGGSGGGGGGGVGGLSGAGGGGGGAGAGLVVIFAKTLIISATGVITAKGGNGGDGGDASNLNTGGGGAGGGGGGGAIYLVSNSFTITGTATAAGGTKGNAGNGNAGGSPGAGAPTNGSAGIVVKYNGTTRAFI